MNDITLTNYIIGSFYSVGLDNKIVYIHPIGKNETSIFKNYRYEEIETNFHDLLLYALDHEELHLVLDKLGIISDFLHAPIVLDALYELSGFIGDKNDI